MYYQYIDKDVGTENKGQMIKKKRTGLDRGECGKKEIEDNST